jgi:hypothetical protein
MPRGTRRPQGISQQPGNSWKYLYERLTEKRFQQLCSALLAIAFPDAQCFPVGQKDGGRDGRRKVGGKWLIYQVKWSSKRQQNPVSWLDAAINEEAENIRRLVRQGAKQYVLLTCVAGTSVPERGGIDRLEERLEKHSKEFGIDMSCWWQADIDARVDNASDALKWTYSEMLAGHDAFRYLLHGEGEQARNDALRSLLLRAVGTQWQDDAKVKFKQAELDTHNLADLFVDVESTRLSMPQGARELLEPVDKMSLGGAAAYLLTTPLPFTLVRGEPGQGKSTLGQFICQVHRSEFMEEPNSVYEQFAEERRHRLPIRADLRDYADWMNGGDPFSDEVARARRAKPRSAPVEAFLAALLRARGGDATVTTDQVHDIMARFPVLVVLDGLDEVANPDDRSRVVKEIKYFASRLRIARLAQVVVTTRPNASGLAEPTGDLFETIALTRLGASLQSAYLDKWAAARGVRGADKRSLRRVFLHRSAEPHISQLADNPMQLTILLYLIQKRGDSVPAGRTDLYRSYMETFLDREAAKTQAVHANRLDLEEVTSFLGWHMQGLAETESSNGRLPTKEVKKAMVNHLFEVDKDTSMVEDLFTSVTDRVWALTSKVQGTFEFDVQPLREFFAARYLYEYAGTGRNAPSRSDILRELIRRPYWLNTSRFYGGFANPNELAGLVEGLEEEFEDGQHPLQAAIAGWTLLADGVFANRPRSQKKAAELFVGDMNTCLISRALREDPGLTVPSADRGGQVLAELLRAKVAEDPDAPLTAERMELVARIDHEPDRTVSWWLSHADTMIGTPSERAWLMAARRSGAGKSLNPDQLERLTLQEVGSCAAALEAGVEAPPESALEKKLIAAVIGGLASDARNNAGGYASDLLTIFRPQVFIHKADNPITLGGDAARDQHTPTDQQRQAARRRLLERDPKFRSVIDQMKFGRGQSNTTSPWGNTARAFAAAFGPCWLAAEIAVIGAACSDKKWITGGDRTKGQQPFGDDPDYGGLLQDLRINRRKAAWWSDQLTAHSGSLSQATWVLGMLAVAHESVVKELLGELNIVVGSLPDEAAAALMDTSSRLGAWRGARPLPASILERTDGMLYATMLLAAHHVADGDLDALTDEQLGRMGSFGKAAWPALNTLSRRLMSTAEAATLEALSAHGPAPQLNVTPSGLNNFSDALINRILERPATFPSAWVTAAAQRSRHESSLTEVAVSKGWFPR